jgi:F-type H+-transporting ATPase subunit epsilon
MAALHLTIVTPEQVVADEDVDVVVVRGADGDLGILHGHAPLLSILPAGEVMYRKRGESSFVSISGGFLEVTPRSALIVADGVKRR